MRRRQASQASCAWRVRVRVPPCPRGAGVYSFIIPTLIQDLLNFLLTISTNGVILPRLAGGLMTVVKTTDICNVFKVSRQTVKNWRDDGMPVVVGRGKVYRYDLLAVFEWLKKSGREIKING